jgi:hypothetical protein
VTLEALACENEKVPPTLVSTRFGTAAEQILCEVRLAFADIGSVYRKDIDQNSS